jgi:hypothetical protein
VLLILGVSLSLLFGFNTIESLFISICITITLMMLLIFAFGLYASTIIFSILIGVLFVLSIIHNFKKGTLKKDIILFFNNPSFIIFILFVGIYTVLIKNNHIYTWDDFSHWGLAVRSIYVFDGLRITPGILQPQTLGTPIFNAFIVSLAGFKEGFMLCGMYFIYWAALLLPISNKSWRDFKIILPYSIIMYSILILISHEIRPNLYNDAMLSVIGGALVAYIFTGDIKGKKSIAVLSGGIMLLPHIKNVTGIVFALFVISIWLFNRYFKNKEDIKKDSSAIIFLSSGFLLSIFLYFITKKVSGGGAFSDDTNWSDPIGSVIKAAFSPIGIILICLIIINVVFIFILKKKKSSYKKPLSYLLVILIGILSIYAYIKLDEGSKVLINAFIKNMSSLRIYGMQVYKLISACTISVIIFYIACIRPNKKKKFLNLSIFLIVQGLIYCIVLILAYSEFPYDRALSSSSLDRYFSSYIFYAILALLGILLTLPDFWNSAKVHLVSIFAALGLVCITILPAPLTIYNYENDVIYSYTYNYEAEGYGQIIKQNTTKEDKIYIITQGDSGHLKFLMKYTSVPSYVDAQYFSLGTSKYDGDLWSVDLSADEWSSLLTDNSYSFCFLHTIDDYFIDNYYKLFEDKDSIKKGSLYKITQENDQVKLVLIK